jgi:hypothetical protein|tara:strand:+ start:26 stop:397 length:372 start_codon:yes stop_codon:yes gene_type:complete
MISAAGKMLMTFGRGMLRQTKHLSPYKSTTVSKVIGKGKKAKTETTFGGIKNTAAKTMKTKQEFTPLGRYANKGMEKVGISATTRAKTIAGYNTGYKHVRRNKKRYASAVAGAAAWDMMSDDS